MPGYSLNPSQPSPGSRIVDMMGTIRTSISWLRGTPTTRDMPRSKRKNRSPAVDIHSAPGMGRRLCFPEDHAHGSTERATAVESGGQVRIGHLRGRRDLQGHQLAESGLVVCRSIDRLPHGPSIGWFTCSGSSSAAPGTAPTPGVCSSACWHPPGPPPPFPGCLSTAPVSAGRCFGGSGCSLPRRFCGS